MLYGRIENLEHGFQRVLVLDVHLGVFAGFDLTRQADILDIGRASLYRAIESLENEGVMKYQDGKFYVQDAEKLISINERK